MPVVKHKRNQTPATVANEIPSMVEFMDYTDALDYLNLFQIPNL